MNHLKSLEIFSGSLEKRCISYVSVKSRVARSYLSNRQGSEIYPESSDFFIGRTEYFGGNPLEDQELLEGGPPLAFP